jgi:hypothetical protein
MKNSRRPRSQPMKAKKKNNSVKAIKSRVKKHEKKEDQLYKKLEKANKKFEKGLK